MDAENQQISSKNRFPFFVIALCLPLIIGGVFFVLPQYSPFEMIRLEMIFVGYASVLLAFFSGIRLGTNLLKSSINRIWLVPFASGPLLGLFVLVVPFSLALATLAVGFGAHGAWDALSAFKGELPGKYSAMRSALTWLICALLILVFVLDGVAKSGL